MKRTGIAILILTVGMAFGDGTFPIQNGKLVTNLDGDGNTFSNAIFEGSMLVTNLNLNGGTVSNGTAKFSSLSLSGPSHFQNAYANTSFEVTNASGPSASLVISAVGGGPISGALQLKDSGAGLGEGLLGYDGTGFRTTEQIKIANGVILTEDGSITNAKGIWINEEGITNLPPEIIADKSNSFGIAEGQYQLTLDTRTDLQDGNILDLTYEPGGSLANNGTFTGDAEWWEIDTMSYSLNKLVGNDETTPTIYPTNSMAFYWGVTYTGSFNIANSSCDVVVAVGSVTQLFEDVFGDQHFELNPISSEPLRLYLTITNGQAYFDDFYIRPHTNGTVRIGNNLYVGGRGYMKEIVSQDASISDLDSNSGIFSNVVRSKQHYGLNGVNEDMTVQPGSSASGTADANDLWLKAGQGNDGSSSQGGDVHIYPNWGAGASAGGSAYIYGWGNGLNQALTTRFTYAEGLVFPKGAVDEDFEIKDELKNTGNKTWIGTNIYLYTVTTNLYKVTLTPANTGLVTCTDI
jgi:hypothetical protein